MIFSADDDAATPTPRLLDAASQAIAQARTISLSDVSDRVQGPQRFPDVWPGEGYKFLAGLARTLRPARVVEIGTGGGTGTLSILKMLGPDARIASFDVVPWDQYPETLLRESDFRDGRLTHFTDDLTVPALFDKHRALFERAELIFLDAAKDGVMEQTFLNHFRTVRFASPPLIVLDDIRVWNMLGIWRRLDRPKLDVTSFGHWTGTGLVDWTPGL